MANNPRKVHLRELIAQFRNLYSTFLVWSSWTTLKIGSLWSSSFWSSAILRSSTPRWVDCPLSVNLSLGLLLSLAKQTWCNSTSLNRYLLVWELACVPICIYKSLFLKISCQILKFLICSLKLHASSSPDKGLLGASECVNVPSSEALVCKSERSWQYYASGERYFHSPKLGFSTSESPMYQKCHGSSGKAGALKHLLVLGTLHRAHILILYPHSLKNQLSKSTWRLILKTCSSLTIPFTSPHPYGI